MPSSVRGLPPNDIKITSSLVIDIGPSFFHLSTAGFNYLFYSSGYNSTVNKLKTHDSHMNGLKSSKLNTKRSWFKVNIFKEKCTCEKCLSGSFFLFGNGPCELRNELLEILCSEICKNWNENWIQVILEQMYLIFCCIKDGVVSRKLLEFACVCAKKLLVKLQNKDLLEYKYSYQYFHKLFIDNVVSLENMNQEFNGYKSKIYLFGNGCTVEEDIIEDFCILSFETEKELGEYTELCTNGQEVNRGYPPLANQMNKTKYFSAIKEQNMVVKSSEKHQFPETNLVKDGNETAKGSQATLSKENNSELQFDNNDPKNLLSIKEQPLQTITPKSVNSRLSSIVQDEERDLPELNIIEQQNSQNAINVTSVTNSLMNNSYNECNVKFGQSSVTECDYLPVFHGCNKRYVGQAKCTCQTFSLGMVLNIGKGRQLAKEAVENLETLKIKDNNEVSFRMATIAASALAIDKNVAIRRVIVPVVSKIIVNTVKNWEEKRAKIEKDVIDLLIELVDKVCKLSSALSKEDGPSKCIKNGVRGRGSKKRSKVSRELNKLSASLVDEHSILEIVRHNASCSSDDCECENLHHVNFENDCEKSFPLRDQGNYDEGVGRDEQKNCQELVQNEISKRTLISVKDGKNTSIMDLSEKLKRSSKLPLRFNNSVIFDSSVLIAKSFCPARLACKKTKAKKQKISLPKKGQYEYFQNKRSMIMNHKLNCSVNNHLKLRSLADVFIWCAVHDKYNCLCVSGICRLKENTMIWRPSKILRYLTNKDLSRIDVAQNNTYEIFLYDMLMYCARTFGMPISYDLRNRSELFITKRRHELEHNILSSTNSIVKGKFLLSTSLDTNNCNEFGRNPDVYKSPTRMEIVRLLPEDDIHNLEEVDVGYNDPPSSNVVICDSDSVHENEELSEVENYNLTVNTNNKAIQVKIPDEDLALNKEHGFHKTYLKPKNYNIKEDKEILEAEQADCGPTGDAEIPPLQETVNIVTVAKVEVTTDEEDCASDPDETNLDHSVTEGTLHIEQHSFGNSLPKSLLDITKFDPELENSLIELKDHPLRDKMYGPDKLPYLSLYCLTAGIGYLPIVEFKPGRLVVQDPILPKLLHCFKNLNSANIWLNKFLKEFPIFETVDICLKWVVVKPGILKLKQSQPFSPAILENSVVITTDDGRIIIGNKKDCIKVRNVNGQINGEWNENKRKLDQYSPSTIVDIDGNDGKKKKIFLETQPSPGKNLLKRPINMVQHYPSKKLAKSPIIQPSEIISLIQNKQSPETPFFCSNRTIKQEVIDSPQFKITTNSAKTFSNTTNNYILANSIGDYTLVPAKVLLPKNLSPIWINQNNNKISSPPMLKIIDSPNGSPLLPDCCPRARRIVAFDRRQIVYQRKL